MDNLTKEQRRKNMSNIRSKDTKIELMLARALRREKVYFARHCRSIHGKPDFVFRRKKIAVFVDSDFWHGHPSRYVMPKSNRKYWNGKIARNRQRDRSVNSHLRRNDWKVIRIWEHDFKKKPELSIRRILNALMERDRQGNGLKAG